MNANDGINLTARIVAQARLLGADLAGVASLPESGTLLVLALSHPAAEPDLDLWGGAGGTEGNRRLDAIMSRMREWLDRELGLAARPLPYQPERGSVLLKDVAALAGLGIIGDNNLLITPDLGSRHRLRAMVVEAAFTPSPRSELTFCDGCYHPCWQACPQNAFTGGSYARSQCERQMRADEAARSVRGVAYCRACELTCPVGTG